ncbi:MAG: heavy metal translocating P-type ATPase [Candidatus Borkfalkiaceae bacterium]|nr:heavy metal translocating P-type ATPase [Christensenellaceae bacterium]
MKKQLFNVTGMSCAACVSHVEKAVQKTAGVKSVNVNLLMKNMTVEYDEAVCSPEDIESSVDKAGYSASLSGGEKSVKTDGGSASCPAGNSAVGAIGGKTKKKLDKQLVELLIAAALLIALMYFSMGNMMWGFPAPDVFDHMANPIGFALIQLVLLIPVLIIYRRYFIGGFKKLFRGAPNMDTLIAIGSSVSVIYGIVSIFILSIATSKLAFVAGLSETQIAAYKSIIATYHDNLYFESAGMILTLVSLGKYLEGLSERKTTKAVEALVQLKPTRAVVIVDGEEKEVDIADVKVGDIVVVKRGANIPVDGIIESGTVAIDQSNITGESLPVEKSVGEEVYASTIATAGYATVKATKVGEDTSFSAIIKLVEEAANSKAPVSRLADKISAVFVPTILIIALLTLVCNLIAGSSFELSLNFAVTVVVIACPCALGLATPVAIMVGTGKAAQLGLIIRNAEILERTKSINVVVFDKTGTITQGKPSVTDFISDNKDYYLGVAYSMENMSEHPLALAVCEYASEHNAESVAVENYSSLEGRGLYGEVNGKKYYIGNLALAKEKSTDYSSFEVSAETLANEGKTPLFIIENGKTVGVIAIKDRVKETAESAVNELIARDIDVIMLTGDNEKTAHAVADEVGIPHVISDVLPQDKQKVIETLKGEGKVVAMVGDGVNDAPALTAADIGIAVGGGSDVAVNSGDIVLLKNDLSGVPVAVDLSKEVLSKIKFGLFWAFFYNVICVFIATGIPYYLFGFKISPMIGALAMSFSSVSVVLNALSVNLFKPKNKAKNSGDKKHNNHKIANIENIEIVAEHDEKGAEMETVIKVKGMMCAHCVMRVENAATSVEGVVSAKADLKKGELTVEHNGADIAEIKQNIVDAGYEVR